MTTGTKVEKVEQSVSYLETKLPGQPEVGLILGSGLGALADKLENAVCISYRDIPHFKHSTAPDHAGRLVYGTLAGKRVLCMQGRLHGYEGYDPADTAHPVYVFQRLGVRALVITNAAGGINTAFHVGDFMLIEDQINMTGKSPLTGANEEALGTRFPDMTFAFPLELRKKAEAAAARCGQALQHGVYCGTNGPQFETPAEIRMFRLLGADAVGMSTVNEVIAAAHCRLPVVAFSMITNMAAGVLMQPLSGAEVNEVAGQRSAAFQTLIQTLVSDL